VIFKKVVILSGAMRSGAQSKDPYFHSRQPRCNKDLSSAPQD